MAGEGWNFGSINTFKAAKILLPLQNALCYNYKHTLKSVSKDETTINVKCVGLCKQEIAGV